MSKNDVPFHRVIMSFVSNMQLPKEIGVNGLSYSYGGSNINFDTHAAYPIVSVLNNLYRSDQYIVFLSFCLFNASSACSKQYFYRKRSYLYLSQGRF